uniref:Biopolymer transporter ExbD n=1 Tax=Schlesneria paludicola TaxID=360056 RepID=A0A7C2PIL9_9PLAN
MAKRKSDSSVIEPDMTPMIDIVFQLLTFFMIVSNFENTKADERVKLPQDALAKPPEVKPKDELVLNIGFIRNSAGAKVDPNPVLFYAGSDIPLDKIRPELEQEKRLFVLKAGSEKVLEDVAVIIRADADVPTGMVQDLIKTCQDIGYTKFSLKATQEE